MRFSRARYVTLCQQSLVTAAVLAVGISAAGVKTLDIVPAPGSPTGAREALPPTVPNALSQRRAPLPESEVNTAPVTPKVREVRVTGTAAQNPRVPSATATPTPSQAPSANAGAAQRRAPQRSAGTSAPTKRVVALTTPQRVTGYAAVGVTWKHGVSYAENQIGIQIRTEKKGRWSGWVTAGYHDEHGPDAGSAEEETARERPGTDAVVIGAVDRVQMRAETTDGSTPPDMKLAVIDPGTGTMAKEAPAIDTAKLSASSTDPGTSASSTASEQTPDATSGQTSGTVDVQTDDGTDTLSLSAMRTAPKPVIYTRAQWGANEKMRDQSAPSYGTVKTGFIHHTVNVNNYPASKVPAMLRSIYAYHTQSRGWRDIGYNYLVDRFGKIWEGRYGGVTRAVVGAHTLGYNEVSFAMSAIGNFDIASPPQAVLNAYASLFAWKLSLYNIRADATHIYVKNRYLNAINGHRDVGSTACPGRYLYAKIPSIRVAAQKIQNAAQTGAVTTPKPPAKPNPLVFTSPSQSPRAAITQPTTMTFPRSLNLAGDANPDLVVRSRTGVVSVIPTGGQMGYRAPVSSPSRWSIMNLVVAVGDVTGDGRGDVLGRLRADGTTRVYAGDGAGRYKVAATPATLAFRYANVVTAAGDWNRDGRNDVLMRDTKSGWLWMFPGAGGGRFGTPTLLSKSFGGFSSLAVTGDLNADGRPDVVGVHTNGYLYVDLSTRTGALAGLAQRQRVGTAYDALMGGARDVTGDGYGDLVIRSSASGRLGVLPGSRDGRFGAPLGPFDGAAGLTQLSSAPVSGSAQPDVVGMNKAGTALVTLTHNGLSNIRPALASNLTRADATQVLNVGDWNRDGRGDVITRQTGGDSLVLRPGLGNGKFANGIVMSRGWKAFTSLAALGDVTGDRIPDLVGKTKTGATTIFPGNGRTGFLSPIVAATYVKSFNQIGTGSWKPQQLPGSAYVSSDGSFVPFMGVGAGDPAAYDWMIGPGDLDGDGRADLVARDAAGTLWLLPGTATGYGERRRIATGFGAYSLGG